MIREKVKKDEKATREWYGEPLSKVAGYSQIDPLFLKFSVVA